ncbi:hypothetical protein D3C76_1026960 [compost metagenome]
MPVDQRQLYPHAGTTADLRAQVDRALVRTHHRLDHGQAQAGTGGLGGKERLAQTAEQACIDATAGIADAQVQATFTAVQVHLQPCRAIAGLQGIFNQVEQGADQGVAVAQQFTQMAVALPAHGVPLHMRLGRLLQGLEQRFRGHPIPQRQLATGKHQHVAHLVFQFVQALLQGRGEALTGLRAQRLLVVGQVAGIQHGCRQRCADLVGQRGNHAPQRRQPLVASQLVLEATGFSQVVEQHQLARLGIQ